MSKLSIYYRISDRGYPKQKPEYVTPDHCLKNFIRNFCNNDVSELTIIADNCSNETIAMVGEVTGLDTVFATSLGNAGSFRFALDEALKLPDDEVVYFVEQDYVHRTGSRQALLEGIEIADFVSLYDHPDRYKMENTVPEYIFRTQSSHWRTIISNTMTFACKVGTLRKSQQIIRNHCSGQHPHDNDMWIELRRNGYLFISPMPAFCSHGETLFMSPGCDWERIMMESL